MQISKENSINEMAELKSEIGRVTAIKTVITPNIQNEEQKNDVSVVNQVPDSLSTPTQSLYPTSGNITKSEDSQPHVTTILPITATPKVTDISIQLC